MKTTKTSIGPVPQAIPENAVPEAIAPRPLTINKTDQTQQALANSIGWPEVERIARSSRLPGDLQRGPFDSKKNSPVFLTKRRDKKTGPVIERA